MKPADQLAGQNDISCFEKLRFPRDGVQLGKLRGSGLAGIFYLPSTSFSTSLGGSLRSGEKSQRSARESGYAGQEASE